MSRLTAALLSHVLVVSAAAAQTPATLDSIDRYVRTEVTRYRIPGLSLAVLRGDSVVLARGYGYANVEHRVPATDSTVYQSGSVGKQFTAAAIVMLAEHGRLSLDDSIDRKSTRLNSSHRTISYAVFCLKKKKKKHNI